MIKGMKDGDGKSWKNRVRKWGKYLQEQEMFRQKMNDVIQQGEHGGTNRENSKRDNANDGTNRT